MLNCFACAEEYSSVKKYSYAYEIINVRMAMRMYSSINAFTQIDELSFVRGVLFSLLGKAGVNLDKSAMIEKDGAGMGLLDLASGNSLWRGYDYYKDGKVLSTEKTDNCHYAGIVSGSEGAVYEVVIDLSHPKKSTCNCPHAEGTRRVCKHKVALYFSVFPEEAERVLKEAEEWEAEEEKRLEMEYKEIEKYVYSLSKQELREELLWRMIDERNRNKW